MAIFHIDKVLKNFKEASSIIIQDTKSNHSHSTCLISQLIQKSNHQILIQTDTINSIQLSQNSRIFNVPLFKLKDFNQQSLDTLLQDIQKTLNQFKSSSSNQTIDLIVDNLNHFQMILTFHSLYKFLTKLIDLSTENIRVLIVYHQDLKLANQEKQNQTFKFDNLLLLLGQCFMTLSYQDQIYNSDLIHTLIKKKSGKVLQQTLEYSIKNGQFNFNLPKFSIIPDQSIDETEIKKPDPTANLSFNLSLTDQQKQQKENLVLPYLAAQETTATSGLIHYTHDEGDDFDEEDPDDDLDI
ncbi:hypothetical protein BC833DRAFT_617304 [Globomyces pollinis-pini]|nr:hypothetical protein BC833DRAFT_617304 [Globomyces pollinis-pini]